MKTQIIQNYINAYNTFDTAAMLTDLDHEIVFHNISNGEINLTTEGIEAFKQQAETAASYFTVRHQEITSIVIEDNQAAIELQYHAVLAKDLSDKMKEGDEISLNGKTIFYFKDDRIIKIEDVS